MSLVIRSDKVSFVVNGERVHYSSKGKEQVKLINADAEMYGSWIRRESANDGSASITFSQEKGVSAGDYIKSNLPEGQRTNAIYAEELEDLDNNIRRICVVIVDDRVVADLDMDNPATEDVMNAIFTEYGDVSFKVFSAVKDNLILSASAGINPSFFQLADEQYIDTTTVMPLLKNAREEELAPFVYQSLSEARKSRKKAERKAAAAKTKGLDPKKIVYILLLLGGLGYIAAPLVIPEQDNNTPQVDPFLDYRSVIKSMASPVSVVNESLKLLYAISNLKGWEFDRAGVEVSGFEVVLKNKGGDITSLNRITKEFGGFQTASDGNMLKVTGGVSVTNREFPYVIYRIDEIEYLLYEEVVIKSGMEMAREADVASSSFVQQQFRIEMPEVTISELQRFSVFLKDKPIVVNKVTLLPSDFGYKATVSVTIFGVRR